MISRKMDRSELSTYSFFIISVSLAEAASFSAEDILIFLDRNRIREVVQLGIVWDFVARISLYLIVK